MRERKQVRLSQPALSYGLRPYSAGKVQPLEDMEKREPSDFIEMDERPGIDCSG